MPIFIFQGRHNGMDMYRLAVAAEDEQSARAKAEPYLAGQRQLSSQRNAWFTKAGKPPREAWPPLIEKLGPIPPGSTGPLTITDLLETHDAIYVIEDCYE
jgi:hypothetical protein